MVASFGSGGVKQGQSNERDSGSDGERSNEAHEEADQAGETDKHLEEWAHHDGPLQLQEDKHDHAHILVTICKL